MTLLHRLASIVRGIVKRDRAERDLHDELQAFVDMAAADQMRDGVAPDEARRLAVLQLGGVEQAKERVRTGRHGWWLDEIGRDLRYAVRMAFRDRTFTVVVVLTLALGIGANSAIFSLIDALMLRMLPVRDPRQLVLVEMGEQGRPAPHFSYAIARALSERGDVFATAAGFSGWPFTVGAPGSMAHVQGALVTGAYYETLGLNPAAGRLLTRADDEPGASLVAVISHGYWERQFANRPDAVGGTLTIGGVPVTIVGVSPRGFVGANVGERADITMAAAALPRLYPESASLLERGNFWLRVLARPAAGISIEQAAVRLNTAWPQIAEPLIAPQWPASRRQAMAASVFQLSPGGTGWASLRDQYTRPLLVLMGAVAVVLLIACANVASLLLARASTRQREMAVRLAMGASRSRVVRQMLIESTLLSLTGAAIGLALASIVGGLLIDMLSTGLFEVALDLGPNPRVLAFHRGGGHSHRHRLRPRAGAPGHRRRASVGPARGYPNERATVAASAFPRGRPGRALRRPAGRRRPLRPHAPQSSVGRSGVRIRGRSARGLRCAANGAVSGRARRGAARARRRLRQRLDPHAAERIDVE